MRIFSLILLSLMVNLARAETQNDGYAVIKQDTIYGTIRINFDAGNITIEQDSVNRVYLSGIESVTLFNETRDTYLGIQEDQRTTFYKILVKGNPSLLEKENHYYCKRGSEVVAIDLKLLYDLFGKKQVKDYAFVRNISLESGAGLIDLFRYYNSYADI